MLDSVLKRFGLASPFALVVLMHGVAAYVFAIVFFIETCGYSFPLFSLGWQHPNWVESGYTRAASGWIAIAIATFASYETFFLPFLPASYHRSLKIIFFVYHLGWCAVVHAVVTICAAQKRVPIGRLGSICLSCTASRCSARSRRIKRPPLPPLRP